MEILLVDDHTLFRQGLRSLLANLDPTLRISEAGSSRQAMALAGSYVPELILLDLKLPDVQGLDGLKALGEAFTGVPIVVLSGEDDPEKVRATIDNGAMGFIPKDSSPEILVYAMKIVLAHGIYLPPQVLDTQPAARVEARQRPQGRVDGLSEREREVLKHVIRGKPNKVIAREMSISEGTVKAHLSTVLKILGVRNRTEAVYAAAQLGIQLG